MFSKLCVSYLSSDKGDKNASYLFSLGIYPFMFNGKLICILWFIIMVKSQRPKTDTVMLCIRRKLGSIRKSVGLILKQVIGKLKLVCPAAETNYWILITWMYQLSWQ